VLADLACAIADGDYSTSAANLGDASDLYRSLGHRLGEAETLSNLGVLQRSTGDYTAAEATSRLALEILCDLGDRPYEAWVLNGLDMGQQLARDYQGVAASHQRALQLFRDLGNRLGQAEALNKLGELATRTQASSQAGDQHTQARSSPVTSARREEARALQGIGNSQRHDGNPSYAAEYLRQALVIY
jgi:tetratricopeptide (TPR) repeat protein